MKTLKITLSAVLALAALSPLSFAEGGKAVYGSDDRLDFFEAPPEMRALADSVVSFWDAASVEPADPGEVKLKTGKLTDKFGGRNLCPDEKFQEQPIGASCSGALVGEDLVITAGHCMKTEDDCKKTRIVFGYAVKEEGGGAVTTLPAGEVYGCAGIITRFMDGESGSYAPADSRLSGADFALIRLDRRAAGHKPLAINRGADLRKGDGVFVIGHPSGLPLKAAGGAAVRGFAGGYFTADLDIFHGNSGSPVFNSGTGLIEGLVARNDVLDFNLSPAGCVITATHAQTEEPNNDISRIAVLSDFIPELK